MVSILNNDDHPSFAIRSNTRLGRNYISPTSCSRKLEQQPPHHASEAQPVHQHASSESSTLVGRRPKHSFDPMAESVQPATPGSSDGSAFDYFVSQPLSSSTYHPYAHQDARREHYRCPSRAPAAPRTPPELHSDTATETQTGAARGTGRKNKYPCPYSATHSCTATFTTSGHAARHGKKHTGEKSVPCPICNKAFTRKDNMKQHIRTHRTHSDEMRSTSEPEGDSSCWMGQPDSSHASSTHSQSVSQSTGGSALTSSGGAPRRDL